MSINLRSRKSKVVIYKSVNDVVGLDVSANFLYLTGSDSKLDVSGLISFTGQIELADLYRGNPGVESLDDRINPTRWATGNKILVDTTDSAGSLVRYSRGFLRILNSSFNPVTRRLTLEVGDILALLSFRQPEDDKSGVEVGVGLTRTAIINNLLTAAGVPNIASGPTDVILYRLPRFQNSYIQQAAQVAFAAGWFIWSDLNEVIRCDRIDLKPAIILKTYNLSRDVAKYERLSGSEKPCEIIRANGTTELLKDIANPQVTVEEIYSTKGKLYANIYPGSRETILESRTTTTTFWDVVRKIETTTIKSEAPFLSSAVVGFGSSITISTSTAVVLWKTDTTKRFFDGMGRLVRVEHTDSRPPGYWVVYAHTGTNKTPIIGASDTITYTYGTDSVITSITRAESKLLTAVLSGFLTTNYNDTGNTAFKLVPFRQTTETWAELRKGHWKYSTSEATSKEYLAGLQSSAIPGQVSETTTFTVTSSHSESGINCSPPQTEYHQPKFDSESKQLVGEARFNTAASPFKPRIREYSIEYATSVAQLNAIAQTLGGFLYGRDKGQQLDIELSDTILNNYKPLARVDVYEGGTSTQSLLLDGCNWVLTQNTAKLSADAVWSGSVATSEIASINTATDEITSPAHGLTEAQPIVFIGMSLPVAVALGIEPEAVYYVSPTSPNTYTISEVPGGIPVVLPLELPASTSPIVAVGQNPEAVAPPYSIATVMRGGFRFGGSIKNAVLPTYGTMRGGLRFGGSMIESAVLSTTTQLRGGFRFGGLLASVILVNPITGSALWLKGSLTDSSGFNRDATPVGVNSPSIVTGLDLKPALRFSSAFASELEATSFLAGTTGATLYVVFTPNDSMYNLIQTSAIDDYWRFVGDGNGYIGTFLGSRIDGYPLSMPSAGSHLISIHASGTSYEVRVDNISKGVQSATYTPGTQFRIATGGGKAYNGDISEVLVYPTAIAADSADHIQNIDYFKTRYPSLVLS